MTTKGAIIERPEALPFYLPKPAAGRVDLLVVAGEHSGDEHAALAGLPGS